MDREIASKLASLPALDQRNVCSKTPACKVCGGKTRFFDVVDFNKHCSFEDYYCFGAAGVSVSYYRCLDCGFLFTDFFNDWNTKDFARFIYNDDYVKVDSEYVEVRPRQVAADMVNRFRGCEQARILDYGSGTGAFAKLMKDAGYEHIMDYDPFSNPTRPQGPFDIITCFEVIEHAPDPVEVVRDMRRLLSDGGCIIFSQTLQPQDIEQQLGNWWYIGPRNGHLLTFTLKSLALVASINDLTFYLGTSPHAFAAPHLSPYAKTAVRSIDEPLVSARLVAPSFGGDTAEWHAAEGSVNVRFRWSKTSVLSWKVPEFVTPCSILVSARVMHEVEPGFVQRCQFRLGDEMVAAEYDRGELRGTIRVDNPATLAATLQLITPEPMSPRELRGAPDDRKLGVAIAV